jgi:hypothetical protein
LAVFLHQVCPTVERASRELEQQVSTLNIVHVVMANPGSIEETAVDDRTEAVKRKLKRLQQQLATYQSIQFGDSGETKVETVIQQLVARASTISGIRVTRTIWRARAAASPARTHEPSPPATAGAARTLRRIPTRLQVIWRPQGAGGREFSGLSR